MTDYKKLKRAAYEMVVEQGKTQREAAAVLGVNEGTLSDWAQEGGWRELRRGRQSAAATARDNILRIISLLSQQRLDIEDEINTAVEEGDKERELELRRQASSLSLDLAYQNKALAELNREKQVTLGIFIDVFDEVFSALRGYDPDLFDRTVDFQTSYLRRKSAELG